MSCLFAARPCSTDQASGLLKFRLVSACQFVGYVCLPLHCRNAAPLLVTLIYLLQISGFCRRQRHDLIGGVPVVLRQVEHVSTAIGVLLAISVPSDRRELRSRAGALAAGLPMTVTHHLGGVEK